MVFLLFQVLAFRRFSLTYLVCYLVYNWLIEGLNGWMERNAESMRIVNPKKYHLDIFVI